MGLIPTRSKSKKQKAVDAAGKAGKKAGDTVAKAKPSGKVLKGAIVAIVGVVTLQAIRSKMSKKGAPADATPFPDTTPIPDPGQSTAGSAINGSAPQPDPAAPFSPPLASGTTPPQGDPVTEDASDES